MWRSVIFFWYKKKIKNIGWFNNNNQIYYKYNINNVFNYGDNNSLYIKLYWLSKNQFL